MRAASKRYHLFDDGCDVRRHRGPGVPTRSAVISGDGRGSRGLGPGRARGGRYIRFERVRSDIGNVVLDFENNATSVWSHEVGRLVGEPVELEAVADAATTQGYDCGAGV